MSVIYTHLSVRRQNLNLHQPPSGGSQCPCGGFQRCPPPTIHTRCSLHLLPSHLLWPIQEAGILCARSRTSLKKDWLFPPCWKQPSRDVPLRWRFCEEAHAGHVEREAPPAPRGPSHPAEAMDLGVVVPSWTFQSQQRLRRKEGPPG